MQDKKKKHKAYNKSEGKPLDKKVRSEENKKFKLEKKGSVKENLSTKEIEEGKLKERKTGIGRILNRGRSLKAEKESSSN